MAKSILNRLYDELTAKTNIMRIRDVRLERLAMARAYEMRIDQGLTFDQGEEIQHQFPQIQAAVWPWQGHPPTDPNYTVTENATWHYYPESWCDPIDAAIDCTLPDGTKVGWWNSADHRQQLMDMRYSTWGHGIYFEDVDEGARRWYFITMFSTNLEPLTMTEVQLVSGRHVGFHLMADGRAIHRMGKNLLATVTVPIDDRQHIPGRGPMIHTSTAPLNDRWIADDPTKVLW
jgi:hypothetical protein